MKTYITLMYYATFTVRKLESLFYKIDTLLQKTTACIRLQAEQIFTIKIYTFFSILGMASVVPPLFYLQKLQLLVVKKISNNFCSIALLFVWAQKVCLRFLKSYLKIRILFLSFVVSFFSRYVQLKSSFSDKKNISAEIWDTLLV